MFLFLFDSLNKLSLSISYVLNAENTGVNEIAFLKPLKMQKSRSKNMKIKEDHVIESG